MVDLAKILSQEDGLDFLVWSVESARRILEDKGAPLPPWMISLTGQVSEALQQLFDQLTKSPIEAAGNRMDLIHPWRRMASGGFVDAWLSERFASGSWDLLDFATTYVHPGSSPRPHDLSVFREAVSEDSIVEALHRESGQDDQIDPWSAATFSERRSVAIDTLRKMLGIVTDPGHNPEAESRNV
jgi:hypothetical protein